MNTFNYNLKSTLSGLLSISSGNWGRPWALAQAGSQELYSPSQREKEKTNLDKVASGSKKLFKYV